MENYIANNRAEVIGIVSDELELSHEIYGEKFYTFTLEVPRLSGISDNVKIMVSDRLLSDVELKSATVSKWRGSSAPTTVMKTVTTAWF